MTGMPVPDTVTLHVPFRCTRRGGRKQMLLPQGIAQSSRTDSPLIKALARAFRWKRMLEGGEVATIADLARQEGISRSYVTKILGLTLLSPQIVAAIVERRLPACISTADVLERVTTLWAEQEARIRGI